MEFDALLNTYETTQEPRQQEGEPRPRGPREERLSREDAAWRRALETGAQIAAENVLDPDTSKGAVSKDLAVCLLCVDGLPFEAIWRHWARRCDAEAGIRVKFYVHAHRREKVRSSWLRDRLIDDHFDTKWGSVDLVRATCALFAAAVRDNHFDTEYVALASETCLPIATPRDVDMELFQSTKRRRDDDDRGMKPPRSWVAAFDRPDNGYAVDKQWRKVHPALPPGCIWKAPQWILLTRAHARILARAVEIETNRAFHGRLDPAPWRLFHRVTASDELFFPSLLALAGELRRRNDANDDEHPSSSSSVGGGGDGPRLLCRRLTWCDWSAGGRSPATHPCLTVDTIRTARAEGCLFARKFSSEAVRDPSHWDDLIALAAASVDRGEDQRDRFAST